MNDKPWNICVPRPGANGKTYWTVIGKAWQTDNGGFRLLFDALPIPNFSQQYGLQVQASIFPPRDDDRKATGDGSLGGHQPGNRASQGGYAALDDDIPFAPW